MSKTRIGTMPVLTSLVSLLLMASFLGCSGADAPENSIPSADKNKATADNSSQSASKTYPDGKNPLSRSTLFDPKTNSSALALPASNSESPEEASSTIVVFETDLGDMVVELDAANAPATVANFLETYVDQKRFDGMVIHHAEPDYIVATGGFYAGLHEIQRGGDILNEANNGKKAVRGSLTMARHPDYKDSANSEFWFNVADIPDFDHQQGDTGQKFGYCTFGQVVQGLDVLDRIAQVPTQKRDEFRKLPVQEVVIKSVHRLK